MKATTLMMTILATVSCLFLVSCTKDQDKDKPVDQINPYLLPGMWKLTSHLVADKEVIDQRSDDCIRDNSIYFHNETDLLFDEGQIKCSPADLMISRGKYNFNTALTEITTTIQGKTATYKILALTDNTFKIQSMASKEQFVYTKSNVTVVINPNGLVGSWKLTDMIANGVQIPNLQNECYADDIHSFTSENKMIVDDMGMICKPGEANPTIGSYTINTGHTKMTTSIGGITEEWDIMTLTATTLVISGGKNERATFARQ